MAKPKWIIGAGMTLAIAIAAGGYWVHQPTPGVTIANCKRLHQGMPLSQVEAVLGKPREIVLSRAEVPVHWFGFWEVADINVEIMFSMEDNITSGGWVKWHDPGHNHGIFCGIPAPASFWVRIYSWIEW